MTKLTCLANKPITSGMKIRFEFLFVRTNFPSFSQGMPYLVTNSSNSTYRTTQSVL